MATVSERVYSQLPNQPPSIEDAFELNKTVPGDFCDKYLEENVKNKATVMKGEHRLGYSTFMVDPHKPLKKLPIFNKKQKILSCKEKRKLRIHSVPKTGQKYSDYLKLHHLWLEYMQEVLKFKSPAFSVTNKATQDIIIRADYHGCLFTVHQSKCPSYVGVTGIVVQETRGTFTLINKQNIIKVIPKSSSTFKFTLGNYEAKIYGKHFNYRPVDRIAKRFKMGKNRFSSLDP